MDSMRIFSREENDLGSMDMNRILQEIDWYYESNRGQDAERLMQEAIVLAVQEQEDEGLLQLLNELLGYYRETGRVEDSYIVAEQAIAQAGRMGLEGTIPYATTLLNVANAYRAGGRLTDSLQCYLLVQQIYERQLSSDNMLVASLNNNLSLLYQEMGNFRKAKECLLQALAIVKSKGAEFETAVSYTNLAGTCLELQEQEEAYAYAIVAITLFGKLGVADSHYGAALSALGTCYYKQGKYAAALESFRQAMDIMERNLGRNEYYFRLRDNADACEKAIAEKQKQEAVPDGGQNRTAGQERAVGKNDSMNGLSLSRNYYETYGRPMLEDCFPEFLDKIAVGLVGKGSDCFGYDDELSRDHDWGPDICIWVTDETYAQIGEALKQAYTLLPDTFMGYRRTESGKERGRRGVMTISSFYHGLLQASAWEDIDWRQVSDASLAAAVNGEVFADPEGVFTKFRKKLQEGYPLPIRFLKIAESAARFSQAGQYNYPRLCKRGDLITAQMMLSDCIKEAMKLQHYIEGTYPPHDKWLYHSLQRTQKGRSLGSILTEMSQASVKTDSVGSDRVIDLIEDAAVFFVKELYEENWISDSDPYLDVHTDELLRKSAFSAKSMQELVDKITELEFEAFDKVRNVGGRADCQNDRETFSIMRKSQYLTWDRTMLMQYLYDFYTEYHNGHNLIEEKYGRMMESTAPDEYDRIKEHFPPVSAEKKAIIEQIVQVQVAWMEEFSLQYPFLAANARSVRSVEDNLYNTSYETYLRGEISTYSDKMLELYGRYVVSYAAGNKNLAFAVMENSARFYGYPDLETAEKFLEN